MADSRRYALGNQLDIEQLLLEAQHRWLRPAEICQILQNYKKFRIAPEAPHLPPSGSLFIFDKKVLRYFRKDGHNWRKKKDGKTIKEAHEKLKVGSVDVLHCYYAHGEDNEHFQRRSYWLLEEELSHIVLVHYREVQANRDYFRRSQEADAASPNSRETQGSFQNSETENSASLSYDQSSYRVRPEIADTTNSALASEFDDVESAYTQHASSVFLSSPEFPQPPLQKMEPALSVPYNPALYQRRDIHGNVNFLPANDVNSLAGNRPDGSMYAGGLVYEHHKQFEWGDIFENGKFGAQLASSLHHSGLTTEADRAEIIVNRRTELVGKLSRDGFSQNEAHENHLQMQAQQLNASMLQQLLPCNVDDLRSRLYEQSAYDASSHRPIGHGDTHPDEPSSFITVHDEKLQNSQCREDFRLEKETDLHSEQSSNFFSMAKHLIDSSSKDEVLKKNDSFNRWMSKELGDVNQSGVSSSTGYWPTVDSESPFTDGSISSQYMLGPSLSDDQLFSIIDFSPNWAYAGSETEVLITGKFLKNPRAVDNAKWSCMFGELEVPASIVADGVLCCLTPRLGAGRVPFCITCSNRVACSELREFEYRDIVRKEDGDEVYDITSDILKMRFERLLATGQQTAQTNYSDEISRLSDKISSLIKDDDNEWAEILRLTSEETFAAGDMKDWLANKTLKEKLYTWLLQKASEGIKGPSILDEDGQGVLHYAAALGHDWAFSPTIEAGVNVNFRDKRGWTALHWAAFCGRERTVAYLVSLGAAPGALADPNPEYPMGRTAADLASSNSHKGIAGYLAEAALSAHLDSLKLKDGKEGNCVEASGAKPVQVALERAATPSSDEDYPPGLSLKDSLAAVCNATQAAARIHQVFRVQSFQRKQIKEYQDQSEISEEDALSMLALKTRKSDRNEPVQAAIRIQNKFRSWKGRKDFLMIRQQIVKIQAHVRGHQARKNYKSFVWSVGIVEKVILRWRRKGAGLRSKAKSESLEVQPVHIATATTFTVQEGTSSTAKDDVYDVLKEGRKQTEGRVQKALARVKSMVQYPEAREQYRRMLNVVQEIGEIKGGGRRVATNLDETADMDSDLIDLDLLLDDDNFMPE